MCKKTNDLKPERIKIANTDKCYEYCTLCWSKTNIQKHTPVQFRRYYVEGVGQLCPKCYRDSYKS